MNYKELKENMDMILTMAESIRTDKNKEYSDGKDALANFKEAGNSYDVHPEVALGIFMDKHLASIRSHIKSVKLGKEPQSSEPFAARIADGINYLLFLYCLEVERKAEQRNLESLATIALQSNLLHVEKDDV